ncbi:MAG: hypothetical protein NTW87_34435 [Planctomycetota bacterium]|nr:hypothetical protein [Planctomycetota bacterium]
MPTPQPLATCYYDLGLALLTANDRGGAKEAFRSAAAADPKWPQPLIWFGFFAALDGDAMGARKQWEAAAKLQPQDAMLREMLGYLAVAMGLQKEGETHFADAMKLGCAIPQEDIYPDQHVKAAPSAPHAAAKKSAEAEGGEEEAASAEDEDVDELEEVDEGAATMIEPAAE